MALLRQNVVRRKSTIMKTKFSLGGAQLIHVIALACLMACSGCATPAVWKMTAKRHWQPMEVVELRADDREAHHDVVVIYRERCLSTNAPAKPRLRAYALNATLTNHAAGKGPAFVRLAVATNLCLVPLYAPELCPTNTSELPELYAVRGAGPCEFTLYAEGQPPRTSEVEAHTEQAKTVARVLLVPICVATDAALVIGVVAVAIVASPSAWGSGSNFNLH